MKKTGKRNLFLPIALIVVFALSRIPGMMPQNFSAAYALVFCAAIYLTGGMAWWLPLSVMLATDVGLNFYYWLALDIEVWKLSVLRYQLLSYAAYALIILLGRRFKPRYSFISLLGGGVLGALIFYVVTNTASWLFNPFHNPEYSKTFSGWLVALTKGTAGYPETWQFFKNSLLSGGLFTALFVGAMKIQEASEREVEPETAEEAEGENSEAKA